jgi:hypothetical protein
VKNYNIDKFGKKEVKFAGVFHPVGSITLFYHNHS